MKILIFFIIALLTLLCSNGCLDIDDNSQTGPTTCYFYRARLFDDLRFTPEQSKLLKTEGTLFPKKPIYIGPNIIDNPVTNLPENNNPSSAPYQLWTMVRFVYGNNLNSEQKEAIKNALKLWEANSNIRFYNATGKPTKDAKTGAEYPYVEFVVQKSIKHDSYLGRIGGRQIINIDSFRTYIIEYEVLHRIGHAMGRFHEQNHPNRDKYININYDNLKNDMKENIKKVSPNYYIVSKVFDFQSIMTYDTMNKHGAVYDFNIPMMTRKDNGRSFHIHGILSKKDKKWANTFYLPYIARSDNYKELDETVYKADGTIMSDKERLELQASLNNGNPTPPPNGRITNEF